MSGGGISDEMIAKQMHSTEAERPWAKRTYDEYGFWIDRSSHVVREADVDGPCTLCGEPIEDGALVFIDVRGPDNGLRAFR